MVRGIDAGRESRYTVPAVKEIHQRENEMNNTITAAYIEEERAWQDEQTRFWFRVSGHSDAFGLDISGEYCWCDENGTVTILDADGSPLTDGDGETEAVRQAIKPEISNLYSDATA